MTDDQKKAEYAKAMRLMRDIFLPDPLRIALHPLNPYAIQDDVQDGRVAFVPAESPDEAITQLMGPQTAQDA